jgi:hypothetical protein
MTELGAYGLLVVERQKTLTKKRVVMTQTAKSIGQPKLADQSPEGGMIAR